MYARLPYLRLPCTPLTPLAPSALSMAAEAGAHEAWVDAAHLLLARAHAGEARDAVRLLEKAAAEGVAEAYYSLGWLHALGDGGARIAANATEAEAHFVRAMQAEGGAEALPAFASLWYVRINRFLRTLVGRGSGAGPASHREL